VAVSIRFLRSGIGGIEMADMSKMEELRKSRTQNFKNVISGKGPVDHIPHFGNMWSWKYYDAGYKFSEALLDYNKMSDAIGQFCQRYPMDVVYETGWRNPIQVTGILGNGNDYIIDDDAYSISIRDQSYMEDGDYEKLIANPKKYLWEEFLPKKFSVLKNQNNSVDFRKFMEKYLEFGGKMGEIGALVNSYGCCNFADPNGPADYWGFGYEILFCIMRGIRKLSVDLRRRPEQVAAACQALDETFAIPRLERGMAAPEGSNPDYCVDMNPVMLAHIILNPKQFERYYWPQFERIIKAAKEKDKLVFLFIEGESKRFWDFFQEFPKDRFAILSELDDVYEMKKALPNCVVCGGMTADLLGRGTPEQCVDLTRKLIEDLGGSDHRYIFSTGKMISFPNDCSRENLQAICNYLGSIHY